jgi:hypothetical protein
MDVDRPATRRSAPPEEVEVAEVEVAEVEVAEVEVVEISESDDDELPATAPRTDLITLARHCRQPHPQPVRAEINCVINGLVNFQCVAPPLRPSNVCLEWQISSTFLVPRPLLKPNSTCQISKTETKFGRILPLF